MIILLSVIVVTFIALVIHELGHLFAARMYGAHVSQIVIGAGPGLFSFADRFGTRWDVRLLPLLGSCALADGSAGSANNVREPVSRGALRQQAVICAAGPLFDIFVSISITVAGSYDVAYFKPDYVSARTAMLPLLSDMSLLVGIANLLPLPPFDGGRLVLLAITFFRGSDVPAAVERHLLRAGYGALAMCSILAIIYVGGSLSR
jgi:membrane-associated protease RseP (regulator of RpoE activity)